MAQAALAAAPNPLAGVQKPVVAGALALIAAIALHVGTALSAQTAVTFLMGCVLGFALYRAPFGFTGPWRSLLAERRGRGVRKTLLMLAVAAVLMMSFGALGGYPTRVHGVGWSLLIGAFLFGIGMQLGGGCGSGVAFCAGGGMGRVMITFLFFVVGSVWGSLDAPWWWGLPNFGRFALVEEVGLAPAILITLAALGALAALTVLLERARHGALEPYAPPPGALPRRVLFGPWSPAAGAVAMGALAGLVAVVTLQPWGVTFGYTLYGVKALTALGFDVTGWTGLLAEKPFWSASWARSAIEQPLWLNNAANMTIGLMLGAAIAAGLVGRWRPTLRDAPWKAILGAAAGGVLMGYGARISTGCNIGALVNGIGAGSLHGWAWMAAAFAGTMLGVRLRPAFRIDG